MLTDDTDLASKLSESLDTANKERREIQDHAVLEATECVDQEDLSGIASLVLANPNWHPGVLGLIAAKLVNRYNRPTVDEGGRHQGLQSANESITGTMSSMSG